MPSRHPFYRHLPTGDDAGIENRTQKRATEALLEQARFARTLDALRAITQAALTQAAAETKVRRRRRRKRIIAYGDR